jgi:hypothetical protein
MKIYTPYNNLNTKIDKLIINTKIDKLIINYNEHDKKINDLNYSINELNNYKILKEVNENYEKVNEKVNENYLTTNFNQNKLIDNYNKVSKLVNELTNNYNKTILLIDKVNDNQITILNEFEKNQYRLIDYYDKISDKLNNNKQLIEKFNRDKYLLINCMKNILIVISIFFIFEVGHILYFIDKI